MFLTHRLHSVKLNYLVSLLNDSFSSWIWRDIGIPACSLLPSVRCGLEMAVLNALAASRGCSIADLLLGSEKILNSPLGNDDRENTSEKVSSRVQICALLNSEEPPHEVACVAAKLVEQGFCTIKLKVARRSSPLEDAAVIQAVREKVGPLIEIRVDANRNWTFAQAMQFATGVKNCNIEYIEEPVELLGDIIKFCEESNLLVALDETIDDIADQSLDRLAIFAHPGVVATVLKPSRLGGFERASLIAKWAQKHGKMAVISAAFESSVSLAAYAQFAYYIDNRNLEAGTASAKQGIPAVAHGLGTYSWLGDDVLRKRLQFCVHPKGDKIEVDVEDAAALLQNTEVNPDTVKLSCVEPNISSYTIAVHYKAICYSFCIMDTGIMKQNGNSEEKTLLFLHGFLGTGEDWLPLMQALSTSARCISIDLPAHGKTKVQKYSKTSQYSEDAQSFPFTVDDQDNLLDSDFSMEILAEILSGLIIQITQEKVVLVGYSMGARIALYMALRCSKQIAAAAVISGSPGLQDPNMRMIRATQDDALAKSLVVGGLQSFVETWYKRDMWESLRAHPHFKKVIQGRTEHGNIKDLAKVLSSLSIGRQPCLWNDLSRCVRPLLLIVGRKDDKFKKIAWQMCHLKSQGIAEFNSEVVPVNTTSFQGSISSPLESDNNTNDTTLYPECEEEERGTDQTQLITMLEVDESGHAVHMENPLPVINAIRKFLMSLDTHISP
eukprot:Gb_25073 [translate_table: standard]